MSDDDSASASSSSIDDILNMAVPFSQQSAATSSPEKSSGKGSDSEDADDSGKKRGARQKKTESSVKKRKYKEIIIESANDVTEIMENKARANAQKKFDIEFSCSKIGTPDKLCWHEGSKKGKKTIKPVRVVPRDETVGLALPDFGDDKNAIQDIQYHGEGLFNVVSKKSLSPYYGKGSNRDRWCPKNFEQYSKQFKSLIKGPKEVGIKTEEAFLMCVLQKSIEEGKQEKKLAQVDEAIPEEKPTNNEDKEVFEIESDEDNDDDDSRRSRRLSRRSTLMQVKKEPLRPGDIIEYYKQQGTAGNQSDLCQAAILAIDPCGDRILTLNDPMTILQPDHMVKRIKRYHRKKLLDYPGQFRPINQYILKKEGNQNAAKEQLAKVNAQVKETTKRIKETITAQMKQDGTGCFQDMLR